MTPLRISGLACPWNKYNSYNELIKPGAFAAFLQTRRSIPMGFMHAIPCGTWDTLKETPEGLWVSGEITDPSFASLVKNTKEFRELSITYGLPNNNLVETFERFNSLPPRARASRRRKGFKTLPTIEVPEAYLTEISIVDDGAFDGTYLTLT